MKAFALGLGIGLTVTIAGCAAPGEPEAPTAGDEQDIFGLGEAKYRVTARASADGLTADIEEGQPLCFFFDATQKNQLFDVAGASTYHDDTYEPFLVVPSTTSKAPWVGVGRVCAGIDGTLYATAKTYAGENPSGPGFRTSGEETYFAVGKLRGVKATAIAVGDRLESHVVRIEGSFNVEFRKNLYDGTRAAFALVAKGEVAPLAAAPKLVVPKPAASASED